MTQNELDRLDKLKQRILSDAAKRPRLSPKFEKLMRDIEIATLARIDNEKAEFRARDKRVAELTGGTFQKDDIVNKVGFCPDAAFIMAANADELLAYMTKFKEDLEKKKSPLSDLEMRLIADTREVLEGKIGQLVRENEDDPKAQEEKRPKKKMPSYAHASETSSTESNHAGKDWPTPRISSSGRML